MTHHRWRLNRSALGLVLLLLIGCAGNEEGNPLGVKQTTVPGGGDPQASDDPYVPAPTPGTTPTPAPTPTPVPVPKSVSILPASVKIWVPATEMVGEPLDKPSSAQLTAAVTMSDGSKHGNVTWRSLAPHIATVDETGRVTAVGPGDGEGPWSVAVEALAPDGQTVGTRQVIVYAEGGVDVIIR